MYKKELGQGSLAIVYLFESKSGKKVAVKTFKKGPRLQCMDVLKESTVQKDLEKAGFKFMPKLIKDTNLSDYS